MQGMSVGEWPNFLYPQYTDQSHMIRDFQHFIGMAPTRYFSMDRPLLTAVFRSLSRLIAEGQSGDLTVQDGRHTLAFRPDTSYRPALPHDCNAIGLAERAATGDANRRNLKGRKCPN